MITNHYWPEEFKITELAENLVAKGHEVSVMSGIPNYPAGKFFDGYGLFRKRHETHHGVQIHRMPLIPRGSGRRRMLILNYLSSAISFCAHSIWHGRKKYDAVLVFNTSPATIALPALIIRKLYSTPVVMWVLDLWPESISATAAIKKPFILNSIRRMMRSIYKRCDKILISSQGFEQSIREVGGYQGEYVYFPNWIDQTDAQQQDAVALPELPTGFKIVFTGNIGAAQDFGTVLDAAERLKDHTDLHWIIVGDGRKSDWLAEEVQRRGLADCFHLLGRFPVSTMPYFQTHADAFLLPLRNAPIFALTVPRKLQAYFAAGKPVIASIAGEGAALVNEAQAGVTCQPQSPDQLAAVISRLMEMTAEQRRQLGDNGREYCERNFAPQKVFARLDAVLEELTGKKPLFQTTNLVIPHRPIHRRPTSPKRPKHILWLNSISICLTNCLAWLGYHNGCACIEICMNRWTISGIA